MRWILLIALFIGMGLQPTVSTAYAQVAPVGNKPLVVIRFNQRQVYYENQMFTALERAVAVKPSVLFEVISYVPTGRDARANADLSTRAQANVNRVLGSLNGMGVPPSRIQLTTERDANLKHQEVHIFVY